MRLFVYLGFVFLLACHSKQQLFVQDKHPEQEFLIAIAKEDIRYMMSEAEPTGFSN